ncbi:MAG TPA: lipoyl(octanoyl) transferase LipB [Solirubrobacteraceae bacterium]|nr:lipoyl(octanoyl) transferase LipB [Solirubrobacteraceae bacterium]
MDDLWVVNAGTVEYREAYALQRRVRAARQEDLIPDVLLLLEHPPVYTRGRRSGADELTMGDAFYRERGIDVVDVERGGKITYHGPGQLVGYPIMRTESALAFVRTMEEALAEALREEGVPARTRPDDGLEHIGVWVDDRKIASVGIHLSRGVTMHGFAVNVCNDLTPWGWIVPCGLYDVQMTSIAAEKGADGGMPCFRKRVAHRFARAHGRRQRLVSRARLEQAVGAPAATAGVA